MSALSIDLAEFVAGSQFRDLPDHVAHQGRRAFVNWLGCAFGGCDDPAVRLALSALDPFGGPPQASVVGMAQRRDILLATLLNATAVSAHAFDDTHFATVAHPTAPAAAALAAWSETQVVPGPEFIHGLVLGIEIQCRVAAMLCTPPAECSVGLSMAGLVGGIGAAVAVSKCMGLSPPQLACAIGLAANQGAGLRENHATLASAATPGHAARAGLNAALLARAGYTCAATVLEGPKGFGASFSLQPQPGAVLAGLGATWETASLSYKPYPTGFVIHPVIDACLQLKHAGGFDPQDVRAVDLTVNPLLVTLTDRPDPTGRLDAIVSTQHWAAAALLRGTAGLPEGSDAAVHDHEITALRRRVRLHRSDRVGREQAVARVVLLDGRTLEAEVRNCLGSTGRPLTDDEIGAKFLAQAELHLPGGEPRARLDAAWRLGDLDQVGPAVRALLAGSLLE